MDFQIRIRQGDYEKKEEVSRYNLFTRICELIDDRKDFRVYTVVGSKFYPSLRYRFGELSMENLDNKNEKFFEIVEEDE